MSGGIADTLETACAVCRFPVALYDEVFNGTPTKVYLHPEGAGEHPPHRAVIGTRAPADALDHWARAPQAEEEDAGDVVEVEPHPEPVVRARVLEPGELPGGAKNLVAWAEKHGVTARVRYARGVSMTSVGLPKHVTVDEPKYNNAGEPELTKTGKQAVSKIKQPEHVVVDSVAAWFVRDETCLAVAVWEDGKMSSSWLLQPYLQRATAPKLREVLAGERGDQ